MYDDLRSFFVECVLADHDAFREARALKIAGLSTDLRLAIHTCSSMLHMADHVYDELSEANSSFTFTSLKDFHSYLCGLTPEFKIVTDCANAHKHRRLSRHNPALADASSIQEVVVVTEFNDEKGIYRIADKEIHIRLSDGRIQLMHICLDAVREMWWSELHRLGIIPASVNDLQAPYVPFPPSREQEGAAALLSIKLIRGERFKLNITPKKYNYHTNQLEPVDLSGGLPLASIYQESHGFDLKITNRETGEENVVEVPISDSEHEEIMAIQSDVDRQKPMLGLAQDRGLLPPITIDPEASKE